MCALVNILWPWQWPWPIHDARTRISHATWQMRCNLMYRAQHVLVWQSHAQHYFHRRMNIHSESFCRTERRHSSILHCLHIKTASQTIHTYILRCLYCRTARLHASQQLQLWVDISSLLKSFEFLHIALHFLPCLRRKDLANCALKHNSDLDLYMSSWLSLYCCGVRFLHAICSCSNIEVQETFRNGSHHRVLCREAKVESCSSSRRMVDTLWRPSLQQRPESSWRQVHSHA